MQLHHLFGELTVLSHHHHPSLVLAPSPSEQPAWADCTVIYYCLFAQTKYLTSIPQQLIITGCPCGGFGLMGMVKTMLPHLTHPSPCSLQTVPGHRALSCPLHWPLTGVKESHQGVQQVWFVLPPRCLVFS